MTKKTVLTVLQMKFIGMEVLKRVRAKRELPFADSYIGDDSYYVTNVVYYHIRVSSDKRTIYLLDVKGCDLLAAKMKLAVRQKCDRENRPLCRSPLCRKNGG